MKKNMGPVDRTIRIVFGIVIIGWAYTSLTGISQWIAFLFALILLISSTVGFCALYPLFKINTDKKK